MVTYLFLFILGSVLGSFYYCISTRLLNNENIITSRSKCEYCNKALRVFDLIPIFSYLFLKGKCHYCKHKLSIVYFISEVFMALALMFSYFYYGYGFNMFMFDIIVSLLLIIYITDFTKYIILDSPLVISFILIVVLNFIYFDLRHVLIALLSGAIMFLSMYLVKIIGDIMFKRESLGGGDIKFSFIIGMILGVKLGLVALIVSTFLALPYSCAKLMLKKNNEVAYGPFLVSSLFLVFLFMDKFNNFLEVFLHL